jgi:hypothetical protein
MPMLVKSFQARNRNQNLVDQDDDAAEPPRKSAYDLVISHFGHRTVVSWIGHVAADSFSNQLALLARLRSGNVRGLTSLIEAFRRRPATPLALNDTNGLKYLTDILWRSGKAPGLMFINPGEPSGAVRLAAGVRLMALGLTFANRKQLRGLEPLVTADPCCGGSWCRSSLMERAGSIRRSGTFRLRSKPQIQAEILGIHYPGVKQALWAKPYYIQRRRGFTD